jgi:hypothetical protein
MISFVNTTFSICGEPIVCTAADAHRRFMQIEMRVLVLEDGIVYNSEPRADAFAGEASDATPLRSDGKKLSGQPDAAPLKPYAEAILTGGFYMGEFVRELWGFLRERKKFWLLPILLFLLLIGALLVLSQGSVVAPFIYTLF